MKKRAATTDGFWHEFFGFLKSKVFMVIVILGAIYLGAVNMDEIKELIEAVKGMFG